TEAEHVLQVLHGERLLARKVLLQDVGMVANLLHLTGIDRPPLLGARDMPLQDSREAICAGRGAEWIAAPHLAQLPAVAFDAEGIGRWVIQKAVQPQLRVVAPLRSPVDDM